MLSCLYQLKSKIPFDFELSPHADERNLAIGHLDALEKGDIVVYDRGYCSYNMLLAHHQKGIHAVFRLAKNTFKVIDEFMLYCARSQIEVSFLAMARRAPPSCALFAKKKTSNCDRAQYSSSIKFIFH